MLMTLEYNRMHETHRSSTNSLDGNWRVALRRNLLSGFLFFLAVLFISSCEKKDASKKPSDGDALVALAGTISQKVVLIEAVGSEIQDTRTGSGFFVTKDGKVATCAHIVEGAKSIRVKTLSGAEFTFKSVVFVDATKDLALLSVATEGVASFEQSSPDVSVGTRIAVLGNPLGLAGSLTDGVVSAIRREADDLSFLQISAPVSPGSSGSPVVTLTGDLVGMVGSRAREGEGIGFALSSGDIWTAIKQAAAKKIEQTPYKKALEMSRKRYLPSKDLWEDPEWRNGSLPEAISQRLVVLRRLSSKHPDVAFLRVEIAKALREDGEHDKAFEECAALVSKDPGNRLAVNELIGAIVKEERKIPFIKSAVNADPLNFHARKYLYEREGHDDDFLSVQLSAKRALEAAPFSLAIAEGYAETLLDEQLHELAINGRPFDFGYGEMMRKAIKEANDLRKVIAAGALMFATPSEAALEKFLDLAEKNPVRALPYAWELNQLGIQGQDEVRAVLAGLVGERLKSFLRQVVNDEPLIAEAYLLEPGAVDARKGLMLNAIYSAHSRFSPFCVEQPFDQLGMVFLLADHKARADAESWVQSPEAVVHWVETFKDFCESGKALGGILPRISNIGKGKWADPLIFQFWLATQKRRFEEQLRASNLSQEKKAKLEEALVALKDVPSSSDAERAIRALISRRQISPWEYFGAEYRRSLESAFEAACSR